MTDPTDYVMVPREALEKLRCAFSSLAQGTAHRPHHFAANMADETASLLSAAPPPPAREAGLRTWRCFHCDEVFTTPEAAQEHFGLSELCTPGCCIDLAEYRRMEEVHQAHLTETDEASKEFHAMHARHLVALVREEEKGYARGLADGRAEAREAGLREVTDEMLVAAMRAFEQLAPRSLRYPEKDKWHTCDMMAMRAAIRAALSQQQETGWRPIEEAPKDGTRVDLWRDGTRWTDCYWGVPEHCCGEAGQYCDSDWHRLSDSWIDGAFNEPLDEEPTHWRPLPAPPAEGGK